MKMHFQKLLLILGLGLSACNVYQVPTTYLEKQGSLSVNESSSSENSQSSSAAQIVYGQMLDRDGNQYSTVQIGKLEWTVQNMRTQLADSGMACRDSAGGKCVQAFYRYSAAMKLCPAEQGWRLPSDQDWRDLVIRAGQTQNPECALQKPNWSPNAEPFVHFSADTSLGNCPWYANAALKSVDLWTEVGLNVLGFAAQPQGYRDLTEEYIQNGSYAYFWSADLPAQVYSSDRNAASSWYVTKNQAVVHAPNDQDTWLSVRCVRDAK